MKYNIWWNLVLMFCVRESIPSRFVINRGSSGVTVPHQLSVPSHRHPCPSLGRHHWLTRDVKHCARQKSTENSEHQKYVAFMSKLYNSFKIGIKMTKCIKVSQGEPWSYGPSMGRRVSQRCIHCFFQVFSLRVPAYSQWTAGHILQNANSTPGCSGGPLLQMWKKD